jgi:hypothetical protein
MRRGAGVSDQSESTSVMSIIHYRTAKVDSRSVFYRDVSRDRVGRADVWSPICGLWAGMTGRRT